MIVLLTKTDSKDLVGYISLNVDGFSGVKDHQYRYCGEFLFEGVKCLLCRLIPLEGNILFCKVE